VVDPASGVVRPLDRPWRSQLHYIEVAEASSRTVTLKARQLGLTSTVAAEIAHHALTTSLARVGLFSRRQDEAVSALLMVRIGLERLPADIRPTFTRATLTELEWEAGPDDMRRISAYPASTTTGRGGTLTMAVLDEFSAMLRNARPVFRSVVPSVVPGGPVRIVFTVGEPSDEASDLWRRSKDGRSGFEPLFIPWMERDSYTEEIIEEQARGMSRLERAREFPATEEEALQGAGSLVLDPAALMECQRGATGPAGPIEGVTYVHGIDVGRVHDPTAIVSLAVTSEGEDEEAVPRYEVVSVILLHETNALAQAAVIDQVARDYGGKVFLELNNQGVILADLVRDRMEHPDQLIGVKTTESSKQQWFDRLRLVTDNRWLRYKADASAEFELLHRQLTTLERAAHPGDAAMALSIAVGNAESARFAPPRPRGRFMGVFSLNGDGTVERVGGSGLPRQRCTACRTSLKGIEFRPGSDTCRYCEADGRAAS
jgi:hypothetical protein